MGADDEKVELRLELDGKAKADLHRMKVCWKACQGIPTAALEQGVVAEMREGCVALRDLERWAAEAISKAEHAAEELKDPNAWRPVAQAMRDGLLASYHEQAATVLAKLEPTNE